MDNPLKTMPIALLLGLLFAMIASASAGEAEPAQVSRIVAAYFADKPAYQPGDLIQQSDFEEIAKQLAEHDMALPSPAELKSRIPSSTSFISRELTSRSGLPFMRRLAQIPGGFHHFQQLIDSREGEKTARQVMRQPGGHKLIRYLAQTRAGANLGRQLPGGRNSSRASNRHQPSPPPAIYTASELVAAISLQFQLATTRR